MKTQRATSGAVSRATSRAKLGAYACGAAAALLSAHWASAAVTTYFGEDLQTGAFTTSFLHPTADAAKNAFLANLTGVTTQDFESIPVGTASPIAVTFGSTTATITGTTAVISNTEQSGAFATSGSNYVFATSDLLLSFSQPQAAFGFYGTDIGDSGATSLVLTLGNNQQETVNVPANFTTAANGSVLYFGFTAPAGEDFTSVAFPNNSAGADYFGFDDFTIATPAQLTTPESSSLPMIALIFGGSGLLMFNRRRNAMA